MKRLFCTFLFLVVLCIYGVAQSFEEVRSMDDTTVFAMNFIDETTLLTLASKTNDDNKPVVFVQKMRNNGEVLASAQVWNKEFLADTATPFITEIFRFQDREPFFYFLKRHEGSDTCTFHKAIIHEDLGLTFEDYDWYGSDFYEINGHLINKTVNVIVNKDGGAVLSYITEYEGIKIVRLTTQGMCLQRTLSMPIPICFRDMAWLPRPIPSVAESSGSGQMAHTALVALLLTLI